MSNPKPKAQAVAETSLDDKAVQEFQKSLRGGLIRPADADYGESRKVYNAMHDRRPALMVHAAGVADVMAAVKLARAHKLLVAVRGGGHSVPGFGTCDGGLVIDLRRMKGIRVDPERRTVRAEGGCTWGDLYHATYAFGTSTPGGVVSTTGIAGLTLGGGVGYLTRRCGLSCDNLVSADVVLADGGFVTCSEQREKELFWAIRGGGGNFGVVTSFEFRLHPVADIYGGAIFFPLEEGVLRAYRDFILSAPEDLTIILGITKAAPLPFIASEWHGKPVAAAIACWSGALEKGERALKPLQSWGRAVGSFVGTIPFPVLNTLFDELLPPGLQHYWKGNNARELTDGAIQAHIEHGAKTPTIESGTFIIPTDGAAGRVAPDATAYPLRDAAFLTNVAGAWRDPAENERNIRWVREYHEALRPHSEESSYINLTSDVDEDRVPVNYRQNYKRLTEIKAKYDPENLFRLNQNIQPAGRERKR
jgi:FAD/FMN-containing dehydrogenase